MKMHKKGFQQWWRETCVGRDYNPITAARLAWRYREDSIQELEKVVDRAIKWIQHDCPWEEDHIRKQLFYDNGKDDD